MKVLINKNMLESIVTNTNPYLEKRDLSAITSHIYISAKDGVLKSFKGANGGFALNGEPENLSIKKIIECAEKRELSVFECSSSALGCPSNKASSCQIWSMFSGLQGKIDEMLDAIKLSDIVKK